MNLCMWKDGLYGEMPNWFYFTWEHKGGIWDKIMVSSLGTNSGLHSAFPLTALGWGAMLIMDTPQLYLMKY